MVTRRSGFSILELLIGVVLLSVVFLGAITVYTSSLGFLNRQQQVDVSQSPQVGIEEITRKVRVANSATLSQGTKQLNVRIDYAPCSSPFPPAIGAGTPQNNSDDGWWHFAFIGTQLLAYCSPVASAGPLEPNLLAPGNPATTSVVLDNIDAANSDFSLIGVNAVGVTLVSTSPARRLETEIVYGAMPTN